MTRAEVITERLGGSALSIAARAGELDGRWYRARPVGRAAWQSYAREVAASVAPSWLADLRAAIVPTGAAAARLERAAQGGIVVTTGQQPGLFGGPLMTFAKALSARAFSDALEAQTGISVAPVFWAATDDADFEEAAVVSIAGEAGAEQLHIGRSAPSGTPMSRVAIGDDIAGLAARLRDACGSVSDPRPLEAALKEYRAGTTVGDAYVALLRELLAPIGIAVLDASHPAVTKAATPLLRRAAARANELADAVHRRTLDIRDAGFAPQVEEVPGLSLLFTATDGVKRRMSLTEAASRESDTASPTVLLRPVMERAILPSAFYVAGPGEMAYFAQISAVANALDTPAPLVLPRWSVMIIEPRVRRQLDELGVEPAALRDPSALEGRLAREQLPEPWRDGLQRLRDDLRRDIDGLRSANGTPSSAIVPEPVIEGAWRSLSHRLERLERRTLAAVKRREVDLMRRIAALRGALYPHGAPQERKLSFIPFLSRSGAELVDEMLVQARAHADAQLAGVPAAAAATPMPPAAARA